MKVKLLNIMLISLSLHSMFNNWSGSVEIEILKYENLYVIHFALPSCGWMEVGGVGGEAGVTSGAGLSSLDLVNLRYKSLKFYQKIKLFNFSGWVHIR